MVVQKLKKSLVCVLVLLACSAYTARGDWSPKDGHKMHEPQLPDSSGWDICLNHQIADDFQCSKTGPITDIHFWISWRGDIEGFKSVSWNIRICEDMRGRPGKVVWTLARGDGEVAWRLAGEGNQGWRCPEENLTVRDDHHNYYQVNITHIRESFNQVKGKVYWLVIAADLGVSRSNVGWKTSRSNFLRPAVYLMGGKSWTAIGEAAYDLAFVITGSSEPEPELDFGDAPGGITAAGYPTRLINNGARHTIGGPWLGERGDVPDAETDGQPEENALGDDKLDGNDDEDGVVIPTLTVGESSEVTVHVGGGGIVEAWVDFDGDRRWEPVSEQVFGGYLGNGIQTITITPPEDSVLGQTFARFRISSKGGLDPNGPANDGEVEDHAVQIRSGVAPDYFEPNDELLQAIDLGFFGQNRSGLGIHEAGEEDWYRWTAVNGGTLTVDIRFSRDMGNLNLELYDTDGNQLAGSKAVETGEQLVFGVEAGTSYYVRVHSSLAEILAHYDLELIPYTKSKNYAVLFSGGIRIAKNYSRYYNNTKDLYETLVDTYDLDPSNIWVLYADGTDTGVDLTTSSGTINSDMSYASQVQSATAANLEALLSTTLANQVNSNDHFFFWSFDHGGGTSNASGTTGEEYLCGWGENIDDEDVADWLNDVGAGHHTVVFTQCFAGGMVDNLLPLSSTTHACAATNHYESSWGDAFAAAYIEGLQNHSKTHDVYEYAYDHDSYATDGEGPGGDYAWEVEHPWEATTTNFPIFADNDNSPPWIVKARTLKYVWPWERLVIPYDVLRAMVDMHDPEGRALAFRIESVDMGALTKGGDPVIPGQTMLGVGESLVWQGAPIMAAGDIDAAPQAVFDAFTIRAFDGATISDQRMPVSVRYAAEDDLPAAKGDTVEIAEDAYDQPIAVLGNDLGNGELTVVGVGTAMHGKVYLVKGVIRYTPSVEFSGEDTFSYAMTDSSGKADSARVVVVVKPVNDPPEAYPDEVTVNPNSEDNMLDVLANDFDAEVKPFTYDLETGPYLLAVVPVSEPAHGRVTPMANGMILYTPDAGFTGKDRFTYRADDGQDVSNEAAVRINVEYGPAVKIVKQLPDETEDGVDIRVDSSDGIVRTVADDFECTSCGLLTDVTLWGSWKLNKEGMITKIHLSIHSDDPVGAGGADRINEYSKPDRLLWEKDFFVGQFNERVHARVQPGEHWWDPVEGELSRGNYSEIQRIDIKIDSAEAFRQRGSREKPIVYWLDVKVETKGGEFGWKTRRWPAHYNDDAVLSAGRGWTELRYPSKHRRYALGFEDLTPGARYNVSDVFITSNVAVHVRKFQWANGLWTDTGHAKVENGGMAGGFGNEINVNNVNLEFAFPRIIPELKLLFGEYGGNCNIEINGDFLNFGNFSEINGKTIGGVEVSVVNGLGNDTGELHLSGKITQFAIGGQELYIDHIEAMNSIDMAFMLLTDPCVDPHADFNANGSVETTDLAFLADRWLWRGSPGGNNRADLNCNGIVAFPDFAILASQWLQSCP